MDSAGRRGGICIQRDTRESRRWALEEPCPHRQVRETLRKPAPEHQRNYRSCLGSAPSGCEVASATWRPSLPVLKSPATTATNIESPIQVSPETPKWWAEPAELRVPAVEASWSRILSFRGTSTGPLASLLEREFLGRPKSRHRCKFVFWQSVLDTASLRAVSKALEQVWPRVRESRRVLRAMSGAEPGGSAETQGPSFATAASPSRHFAAFGGARSRPRRGQASIRNQSCDSAPHSSRRNSSCFLRRSWDTVKADIWVPGWRRATISCLAARSQEPVSN